MANVFLNAAFKCKKFKGSTRLLLLALANRASDAEPRKTGKAVPYGYSFAGTAQLMMDIGASTRDTVIDGMKTLRDAGVVVRRRRLGRSTLTFVDIDALRKLAYTDADKEEFRRKAESCLTHSKGESSEKARHSDVGKSTASDVVPSTTTDGGNIPTLMVGAVATHNLQRNQQECEPKDNNPSVSESVEADTDTEKDVTAKDDGESECCAGKEENQDDILSRKEHLPAKQQKL